MIPTFICLDAINLGYVIHHNSVLSKIPQYYKDESVRIILHAYTMPILSKNI